MFRAIADDGFALVHQWVAAEHRASLLQMLAGSEQLISISRGAGGERYAARGVHRSIPGLAEALRQARIASLAEQIIGAPCVLIDATLFDKHEAANWTVPAHQDRVVAAANGDVVGARVRRGEAKCEPAPEFLANLVALRLHFDRTDERTGALQLIRGSHLWGIVPDERLRLLTPDQFTAINAEPGDVLVLRPLTIHRSPSGSAPTQRRVLHLVYADTARAGELGW